MCCVDRESVRERDRDIERGRKSDCAGSLPGIWESATGSCCSAFQWVAAWLAVVGGDQLCLPACGGGGEEEGGEWLAKFFTDIFLFAMLRKWTLRKNGFNLTLALSQSCKTL